MSHDNHMTRRGAEHTCGGLGSTNGIRASSVTTHGEMLVPTFFARKGPRGTYSHFCMCVCVCMQVHVDERYAESRRWEWSKCT